MKHQKCDICWEVVELGDDGLGMARHLVFSERHYKALQLSDAWKVHTGREPIFNTHKLVDGKWIKKDFSEK